MTIKKVVFSGIQPSGNLHIGNYIGAIRHWVKDQNDGLNIFCVVDMHAITVDQDPKVLYDKTLKIAAILLASGINPEKSILFVQSTNPDHANLAWVLNCFTSMGQLNRMTQFKEKSEGKEFISAGLFDYPVLMAADILLYDTTNVPVGEDQRQHVELTRDIAERFNSKYGQTFILPNPDIPKVGGKIMSLVDPTKKMSKSDKNPNSAIYLLDKPQDAKGKIASATTDSGNEIKYDPKSKPGISNLLVIYSELTDKSIADCEKTFSGKSYKEFKDTVGIAVSEFLTDFQKKYMKFRNPEKLGSILKLGMHKAREISEKKLQEVYKKVGFVG